MAVAAAALLVLLTACGSQQDVASPSGGVTPSPAAAPESSTSAESTEAPSEARESIAGDQPSVGLVAEMTAQGIALDAVTAAGVEGAFVGDLDGAVVAAQVDSPHDFTVAADLPDSTVVIANYRLFAAPLDAPAQEPTITGQQVADAYFFRAEYAIDPGTLPPDLRDQILAGLPGTAPQALFQTASAWSANEGMVIRPAVFQASWATSIGVAVEGLITKAKDQAIDAATDKVKDGILDAIGSEKLKQAENLKGKAEKLKEDVEKAGEKVNQALDVNDAVTAALAELSALEQCVKHPTSKVTRDRFKASPAEQQRQLKQIADARNEILNHAAVIFTGAILEVGSGGLGWVKKVMGPATKWVRDSLSTLIEKEMAMARAGVTPCVGFRLFQVAPGTTAVWEGEKCGGLGGRWKARTDWDFAGGQATGFIRAKVDEDTLTGPMEYEVLIKVDGGLARVSNKGTITLTQGPEDTVIMKVSLGAQTSVSAPKFSGMFATVFPGGDLTWKPDPSLAACPEQ
jgi:hypothetical protein